LKNESFGREPSLELRAVVRSPRTIEQSGEVLEQDVGAALRDEDETVVLL